MRYHDRFLLYVVRCRDRFSRRRLLSDSSMDSVRLYSMISMSFSAAAAVAVALSCGVGFVAFGVAVGSVASLILLLLLLLFRYLKREKRGKKKCISTSINKKRRGIVTADGQDVAVAFTFVFVVIRIIHYRSSRTVWSCYC